MDSRGQVYFGCEISPIDAERLIEAERALDEVRRELAENLDRREAEIQEGMSEVEVIPGTVRYAGGPRPPRVHEDEVELIDPSVWEEVRLGS